MKHLFNLQLFAEGGASASAAAGGDSGSPAPAARPSEARLRELGVPEERLQKRAKRQETRKKGDVKQEFPQIAAQSVPLLGKEGEGSEMQMGEQSSRLLRNHPQKDSSQRERSGFAMKRTSNEVSALHSLADEKRYGVREDDKGGKRSYDIRSHYDSMHRQAAEMAGKYPDFNLQKELDNPTFLRLTGPEIGLPLEDAYMAMHHRELTRAIAEGSRQELSKSIRAGSARPTEHGMEAKAPSVVTFDYKNATKSQRAAFKKQIYDAAARGEKIYPVR